MSGPASYACAIPSCTGTARRESFLLPTNKPNVMRPGELWECNTCGRLWNLDGTAWKPADFVVREEESK